LLAFDYRQFLISKKINQPITTNVTTKVNIAHNITIQLKTLKETTKKDNKGIRLLMEWLEYNPEEGKELFSELYAKRAELFMQTISDKESLYSLMKSKTPLSTLAELANAIENDPDILRLIEDRKKEKIHELIRNEAGEFIENLLKIAFEEKGFKVEKTRYGKDLVISLSNSNKNIDIEVKSTINTGSVSMTSFQTETAIQKGKDYFLCVVNKENMAMTKESVMENSKFVSNIGSLLIEKYNQVQSFNSKKSDLEKEQEGIRISIENTSSYKYKISYDIWKKGISFNEFINLILVR
jgi:hypothetical protein